VDTQVETHRRNHYLDLRLSSTEFYLHRSFLRRRTLANGSHLSLLHVRGIVERSMKKTAQCYGKPSTCPDCVQVGDPAARALAATCDCAKRGMLFMALEHTPHQRCEAWPERENAPANCSASDDFLRCRGSLDLRRPCQIGPRAAML